MHFYRVDFRELLITFSYQAHVLISTAEPNDLRFSKTLFLAVIICFPSQEISRKIVKKNAFTNYTKTTKK